MISYINPLVSKIIIFNQHWECKGRQTGLCLSWTNHHLACADLLTFRFIQMQSGFQEISHKTCPLESHCYRYLLLQPFHGHRSQGHLPCPNISVPPHPPTIYSADGKRMASVLGPYKLGSDLVATCVNSGGLPPPRLVWWRGDVRIDDTYEEVN